MARAWRTCRDACRDHLPTVAGKTFPAFLAHAHQHFYISGKRPMESVQSGTSLMLSFVIITFQIPALKFVQTLRQHSVEKHALVLCEGSPLSPMDSHHHGVVESYDAMDLSQWTYDAIMLLLNQNNDITMLFWCDNDIIVLCVHWVCQHWFRQQPVACLVPSNYLNFMSKLQ